jgi:DMSO/TMAO reductase YedYZ molybdopterin-dependent catalytic subunit
VSRTHAAVAGVAAAGVALGAGELTAALASGPGPSPVTAVGTEFIDRYAASLKDFAVSIFGTNDKVALIVGIVVSSLVLGAVLGLAARRWWPIAPIGFVAFGGVGFWALATDPLGSTSTAVVSALVAIAAGVATFASLWRLASTPAADAPRSTLPRRQFVVGAGAAVVVAIATGAWSRRLRGAGAVEAARRTTTLPRPRTSTLPPRAQPFTVAGLTPFVTPNDDFFRIDTALTTPRVDAGSWRLGVDGIVERPFELTYDELLRLDSVEETITLQCVSNEVGGSLVGNAVWQGVPLSVLLERAAVGAGATQIVGRSVDGFTAGFPTELANDGRVALVAYAMNGEPLPVEHGYPARLMVAGLYGYVSATKWLDRLELTTWEDFDGYWVPRGWSKEGPIKTASRIDVPRASTVLSPGEQMIAGVAWAPGRGLSGVDVQVDDGPWRPCELGDVTSDNTWVQWRLAWDATPGDHVARVRAADGDGVTQTEQMAPPAPNGATGWHSRRIRVR